MLPFPATVLGFEPGSLGSSYVLFALLLIFPLLITTIRNQSNMSMFINHLELTRSLFYLRSYVEKIYIRMYVCVYIYIFLYDCLAVNYYNDSQQHAVVYTYKSFSMHHAFYRIMVITD